MYPETSSRLSWQAIEQQALHSLADLIRFDTTNPPGNERLAAEYLAARLGECGVPAVIREGAPTRANLVARLRGRNSSLPPLLLSSHTDVVPVELQRWSRSPFGGETAEGCIWGRGALDMKSKSAMDLVVMTALARAGAVPERDLIMAAVADEEAGSDYGARFLVERHPELVRAGYVLNEVGGFTSHLGDRRYYPIQIAEKGYVTVKMKLSGSSSHGSMPRTDSAIVRLAGMITKLAHTPMRLNPTPLVRETFAVLGLPVDDPLPLFRPMLANTVTPTMMQSGYKDNVVPGEAWVVLDGRTLPGENPESLMAELREIVGPEPQFELMKTAPPVESRCDTPLYELIRERLEAADPGAQALPWMIPGATDNKHYARLGATCYGFSPVKLGAQTPFGALYHSHDERIPIDGFLWGLRLYADVVLTFLGLGFDQLFC
ncbi:MAG TPA: M20/M25/M40 family metallo-hydrolase [Candidatus Binataceae bacterium]|nr:M20/M25/M40 family metallo-hydrolase [Candidatus Binataceae bacterium]